MDQGNLTTAQQLAQAASAFYQRHTGQLPKSVTVILSENRLVIALHRGLSPVTTALMQGFAGAAPVQESHRGRFDSASGSLREEINRITGVEVWAESGEIETANPAGKPMLAFGTVIQVFLLAGSVSADNWSESCTNEQP